MWHSSRSVQMSPVERLVGLPQRTLLWHTDSCMNSGSLGIHSSLTTLWNGSKTIALTDSLDAQNVVLDNSDKCCYIRGELHFVAAPYQRALWKIEAEIQQLAYDQKPFLLCHRAHIFAVTNS